MQQSALSMTQHLQAWLLQSPIPVETWLGWMLAALLVAVVAWSAKLFLRSRDQTLERELENAQRELSELVEDQRLLTRFIREFPDLSRELHSSLTTRKLPLVLLTIIERAFRPEQALVLLRRRKAGFGGEVRGPLVVVGTLPPSSSIKMGTEIPYGHGQIGWVAEAQQAFDREELGTLRPAESQLRKANFPTMRTDLAAPMVFHEETLGVLAVSRPRRRPAASKELLRLIAQLGALTYFNVTAFRRMKRNAELDRLTGILNKAAVTKALSEEIVISEGGSTPFSIFLFDIDNFKTYNDVNGHQAGDRLLAELPTLVQDMTRDEDIFGRFGGEEFLLILPGSDTPQAVAVAQKIRRRLADHDFPFREKQPMGYVSVSGGIASYPRDGRDSTRLLRLADEALYNAKRQGRNRVMLAKPTSLGVA
jgi:diguanylate cyclase (GGDEF)-like protein